MGKKETKGNKKRKSTLTEQRPATPETTADYIYHQTTSSPTGSQPAVRSVGLIGECPPPIGACAYEITPNNHSGCMEEPAVLCLLNSPIGILVFTWMGKDMLRILRTRFSKQRLAMALYSGLGGLKIITNNTVQDSVSARAREKGIRMRLVIITDRRLLLCSN